MSILMLFLLYLPFVFAHSPPASWPIAPPAGRALLSRSADLEPYDFPLSATSSFDPHAHLHSQYPVLGPPGFWTEPSLRAHYASALHFRYHPRLYPVPPPFEVWLKEQQLIRALALHKSSLDIDLTRPDITKDEVLQHEMTRGELVALLRQTQIATVLRYASIDEKWRKFEEGMYRMWGEFLAVSQEEKDERLYQGDWGRKHLAWVHELAERAKEVAEKMTGKEELETAGGKRSRDGEVRIERERLQASTPRRWLHTPNLGSAAEFDVKSGGEGLREALSRLHM